MKTVLITGGNGLVGNSLRQTPAPKDFELVFTSREYHDLTNPDEVKDLFDCYQPAYVIHTAARVGGIAKNLETPAQQFLDNILMNTHIINEAYLHGVEKLIAFSSVCAMPAVPIMTESALHDGPPFPAHGAYAHAKRMVDVQVEAYRKQYDVNYCSIIPGNIFGEHDNFDMAHGHVVPSLIHKAYLARNSGSALAAWGDGSPFREFIYVGDLARVCFALLAHDQPLPQRLIVSGNEMSIWELVELVASIFKIDVEWDASKPNGQLRRQTVSEHFDRLFPGFIRTPIRDAVIQTAKWFDNNYDNARL
jgi:GDP-L-fucose synthase